MLKAANGLVEILNGSKDPVLVHHVAVVQFLRRRRSNDEATRVREEGGRVGEGAE